MVISQTHCLLYCLLLILPSIVARPTAVDTNFELTPSRVLTAYRSLPLQDDDLEALERRDNGVLQAVVPIPSQQVQNATATTGAGNSSSLNPAPGFIPNDNTTSTQTGCRNLTTGRDNKCWAELDLTAWVNSWVTNNSYACELNEPFTTCFMRLNNFYSWDCSGINLASCTPPVSPEFADNPELFYVTYNIYAINQFFNSWWVSVGNAGSIAADNVDKIVQIVNPPDNTNLIMDNILIALTGIFSIAPIALTAVRASLQLGTGIAAAAQIVENALFAYPQIGRYLFPTGTTESTLIQMASLSNSLGQIIQTVQGNLNMTLVTAMSDVNAFIAFAQNGNFTNSPPSLADQSAYLLYGFNTYIISAGLAGNDVHAVIARDTNPQALSTNGTTLNYDIGCQAYNEQNVCGTWWYSGNFNMGFGLNQFSHMNRDWGDAITQLLADYTTGELLFENAFTCNSQGGYGTPVNVTINVAGVNTACLSQLQTLTWDMTCTNSHDTQCEFIEGPAQNTFLSDCGDHSAYDEMNVDPLCVPYSYMGPLLMQNEIQLQRT